MGADRFSQRFHGVFAKLLDGKVEQMAQRGASALEMRRGFVELLFEFVDGVTRKEIAEAFVEMRQFKGRLLARAEQIMLAQHGSIELSIIAAVLVEHRILEVWNA